MLSLLIAAAAPAAGAAGGESTAVIGVGLITVIGTIATALAPTILEVVKIRMGGASSKPKDVAPDSPAGQAVESGTRAVGVIERVVANYQQQLIDVNTELTRTNGQLSAQDAIIKRLEDELAQYRPESGRSRGGSYGQPGWYPGNTQHGNWSTQP